MIFENLDLKKIKRACKLANMEEFNIVIKPAELRYLIDINSKMLKALKIIARDSKDCSHIAQAAITTVTKEKCL